MGSQHNSSRPSSSSHRDAAAKHRHHRHHHADPHVSAAAAKLGCPRTAQHAALGTLAFGGLLFAAGAAPWSLPWLFVLFAAVCLPWRVCSFVRLKWVFYLLDECYFVNACVLLFLLARPNDAHLEALAYSLADGPLAGALAAWQCPWVFSSAEHTTSVLMHLLPGLAVFAHRHHTPHGLRGWAGLRTSLGAMLGGRKLRPWAAPPPVPQQPDRLALWLVGAPLLFHVVWQVAYFLVVQVLARRFIITNGYETSYTCLARRAEKTNNYWNRLVRRGSITRRVCMYGALQMCFTLVCTALAVPTYFSWPLAAAFQVIKVVLPVVHGARYQCVKGPRHAFLAGLRQLDAVRLQQQQDAAEAADAVDAAAAASGSSGSPKRPVTRSGGLRLRSSCASEAAAGHMQQQPRGVQSPLVA